MAADVTKAPPIREQADQPDEFDGERIALVIDQRWRAQDGLLAQRDRQIEENIRCLAGRQWDVYSPVLGQYVDPTRYMTDEERRWRQRPVVNLLAYWFMLTHARLTEQTPALTFQPATADRLDEMLAQAADPIFKTQWADAGMDGVYAATVAWLVTAGEAYVETGVDLSRGPARQQPVGPSVLSMEGADGAPIERATGPVPYDRAGNPLARLVPPDTEDGAYGYEVTGDAATEREGELAPRVRSPLEVRAEWGADTAWEDKRWICTLSYLSPDVVREQYGVDVPADTLGGQNAGFLERLLFSAGIHGASNARAGSEYGSGVTPAEQYVAVYAMWEQPCDAYREGRLLVVTRDRVLHDSVRPFATKAAGPIRRAQFVQQPGRGGFASTPLEHMIPIQKAYNRGWAQILEHRNLCTNPILITDVASGIGEQVTNAPGSRIEIDMQQGVPNPAYYLTPPSLPSDVWRVQAQLRDELFLIGSMMGAEGSAPTDDASGELVSQLRYNSDRPVSVAARSLFQCFAGVAEDWLAILPLIWTDEKVLAYAGDDQIYKTLAILPEMWSGSVDVRPDLVNARLEDPTVKQQRALLLYDKGALGMPGSPEASERLFDLAKFPHAARFGMQGGPDAATCRQALGKIAQGADPAAVPLFPWYDYAVWVKLTRDHLASPEYLAYEEPTQQAFAQFFVMLQQMQTTSAMLAAAVEAPRAAVQMQAQGAVAHVAQASMPEPPQEPGKPGSAQGAGSKKPEAA